MQFKLITRFDRMSNGIIPVFGPMKKVSRCKLRDPVHNFTPGH